MSTPRAATWKYAAVLASLLALNACSAGRRGGTPALDLPWSFDETGPPETSAEAREVEAIAQFLRAELALRGGDRDIALQAYEAAVAADPDSVLLRRPGPVRRRADGGAGQRRDPPSHGGHSLLHRQG
jgi:hypothetical protein